jgi:hypothetical protein
MPTVECPHCAAKSNVPAGYDGRTTKCVNCGKPVPIHLLPHNPAPPAAVPAPAAPAGRATLIACGVVTAVALVCGVVLAIRYSSLASRANAATVQIGQLQADAAAAETRASDAEQKLKAREAEIAELKKPKTDGGRLSVPQLVLERLELSQKNVELASRLFEQAQAKTDVFNAHMGRLDQAAQTRAARLLHKLNDGTIDRGELDHLQQTLGGDGSDLVPYFLPKLAAARTKLGG